MQNFRSLRRPRREEKEPDVIVGIDIGTSFTKVSYAIQRNGEYEEIRRIQDWQGFGCAEDDTYCIDTVLAYDRKKGLLEGHPLYCGELTEQQRQDTTVDVYELFKEDFPLNLSPHRSPSNPDGRPTQQSTQIANNAGSTDTMKLYRDFLEKLHVAVKASISKELDRVKVSWVNARIDFIFSVPATWTDIPGTLGRIASKLEEVAKTTFGSVSGHTVSIGLTEPEAAAASYLADKTAPDPPQKEGQNILVVDAGGGTTDLCLVKIHNPDTGLVGIDSMSAPVGVQLGSSHIDDKFEDFARHRLRDLSHRLQAQDWDIVKLSKAMRYGKEFLNSKKELDPGSASGPGCITLDGPDLKKYPGLGDVSDAVQNRRIKFTHRELANIFDSIIDDTKLSANGRQDTSIGINKLIHRARDQLHIQDRGTSSDIDIILLSGGLGTSRYLKHRVEQDLAADESRGAKVPRVVVAPHPQLGVSRGLVHNRMWKLFSAQKCNGNYGILQLTKFKPWSRKHIFARLTNQITRVGDKTFVNEIKWLIEKGWTIPTEPPKYVYTFERDDDWTLRIVVSKDDRPEDFCNAGGDMVAEVQCNPTELMEDPKTNRKYCEVELLFTVGKFNVRCWSPAVDGGKLVGTYTGKYGAAQ